MLENLAVKRQSALPINRKGVTSQIQCGSVHMVKHYAATTALEIFLKSKPVINLRNRSCFSPTTHKHS